MYTSPKILYSRQRDRMKAEEEAKERCRRMKRTSEVRPSFFFTIINNSYIAILQLSCYYRLAETKVKVAPCVQSCQLQVT